MVFEAQKAVLVMILCVVVVSFVVCTALAIYCLDNAHRWLAHHE